MTLPVTCHSSHQHIQSSHRSVHGRGHRLFPGRHHPGGPTGDAYVCAGHHTTHQETPVKQVWYADDAAGVSTICGLKQWWDHLCAIGPSFGYHPKAPKTWLITKEDLHTEAGNVFKDTNI